MHEDQQKLKPSAEQTLVNFLIESAERGFPQTLHQIESFANLIRRLKCYVCGYFKLIKLGIGLLWFQNFIHI